MHKSLSSTLLAAAVLTGGVVGVSAVAGAESSDTPILEDAVTDVQAEDTVTDVPVQDTAPEADEAETDEGEAEVDGEREGCERGHRGARGGNVGAVAEILGLEADELRSQLADGATIADIAGDQTDEVIDALVAEKQERLDAAVENGRLTQEEADERLETLTERITEKVNNGFADRGADDADEGEGENA